MNTELQVVMQKLVQTSQSDLEKLSAIHEQLSSFEQVDIITEHVFHAGMYARTIKLEAGVVMMGSLIKKPTILIINGSTSILNGDKWVLLTGYNVMLGGAGRKQMFATHSKVEMTMICKTSAKTVEEAEDEIFAEADKLMSRKDNKRDTIVIGEQ